MSDLVGKHEGQFSCVTSHMMQTYTDVNKKRPSHTAKINNF